MLAIVFAYLIGLFIFSRGFLLSRTILEQENNDKCSYQPTYEFDKSIITNTNDPPEKLFLVVIDALRYDFVAMANYTNASLPYLNNWNNVHGISSCSSQLFNMHADPPTTTMQRLKGIVTGSLPTFIDAGSNFAASSLAEDNLIKQLINSGNYRDTFFLGDETWIQLLPDLLAGNKSRSFPYESFKLFDLHTVDRGIKSNLAPILKSEPYDMIIAHFLGVDHCGHKYGPLHPSMKEKLVEMDLFVSTLTELIPENSLLVVLGDHGMTEEGDHGGESLKEVSSALWIYSKNRRLSLKSGCRKESSSRSDSVMDEIIDEDSKYWDSLYEKLKKKRADILEMEYVDDPIPQIDIVSTLSILTNVPIPFGNLGSLIPDLLYLVDTEKILLNKGSQTTMSEASLYAKIINADYLTSMYECNINQIQNYLLRYASVSGLENDVLSNFTSRIEKLKTVLVDLRGKIPNHSDNFHSLPLESLLKSFESCLLEFVSIQSSILKFCRLMWARFDDGPMVIGCVILLITLTCHAASLIVSESHGSVSIYKLLLTLFAGSLFGISISSVSVLNPVIRHFKLFEKFTLPDFVVLGCGLSLGLWILLSVPLNYIKRLRKQPRLGNIFPVLLFVIYCAGFASNSFIIFEDGINRFMTVSCILYHLYESQSMGHPTLKWQGHLILALLVRFSGFLGACREEQYPYCKVFSHLNFSMLSLPVAIAIISCSFVFSVCIIYNYGKGDKQGEWMGRARLIYLTVFLLVFVYWFLVAKNSTVTSIDDLPDHVSNGTLKSQNRAPVVLSRWHYESEIMLWIPRLVYAIVLCSFCWLSLIRPAVAVKSRAVSLWILLPILIVQRPVYGIFSVFFVLILDMFSALPKVNTFLEILLLVHLGFVFFFSTGHQSIFAAIQWESAFVGIDQVYPPIVFILVSLNTLGGLFLAMISILERRANAMHELSLFLFMHAVPCVLSTIFNSILKRHLMVWKIFTPRWMLQCLIVFYIILFMGIVSRFKK